MTIEECQECLDEMMEPPMIEVEPPRKKVRRATDDKPCSEACVGLIKQRHDWKNALASTVDECVGVCCSRGQLDSASLQVELCKANVHTRKKAVESLLVR